MNTMLLISLCAVAVVLGAIAVSRKPWKWHVRFAVLNCVVDMIAFTLCPASNPMKMVFLGLAVVMALSWAFCLRMAKTKRD